MLTVLRQARLTGPGHTVFRETRIAIGPGQVRITGIGFPWLRHRRVTGVGFTWPEHRRVTGIGIGLIWPGHRRVTGIGLA
ncbi:hypothetical protein ACFYPT_17175 [Streptomyces sp. NPDC005529]|uniref:hypothetical protein n=1 Tax=unclassified Streptomyces TaxID=2593676 RepID=UPI0033B15EC6